MITCEAPHVLDYCYLNTPNKPETEIVPISFSNTKQLGICRFKIEPVSGIYSCGLNDVNGGEDIQTYYKVEVYETPAKAVTGNVEVKLGKQLKLLTKSIFNHPMSYCRFTNPSNEVHGVSDRFNMEGNYRYYGAGLTSGECGLEVKVVTDSEIGLWTCTFSVEGKEYSVQMVVSQTSFIAAYVAIPIIILTVIAGAFIGLVVYRKQRERRARYTEAIGTMRELDLSQSSHES